jgi:nucleoside-diphosphate-sugar epimerase
MNLANTAVSGISPQPDGLIVVAGAGGFIGGALVRHFLDRGCARLRAVDKKPLTQWHQCHPEAENLCLDLSERGNAERAVRGAAEVYNLAADMGGMGFIERHRVECLRSILINTHLLEASWQAGVHRYFFASSACVYNQERQNAPGLRALREEDAYPALPERGYGWEKLISEILCQEYWQERGIRTFIARLHNIYGPHGTWSGGREKAPAALSRKVIEAREEGIPEISIWGTGAQTRSFTFIGDCVRGIDMITHCDGLTATPVNLGSSEMISIDGLVDLIEGIAGTALKRTYDPDSPTGVAGRNSDNTLIRSVLGWEPTTPLREGMEATFAWIEEQYLLRRNGDSGPSGHLA